MKSDFRRSVACRTLHGLVGVRLNLHTRMREFAELYKAQYGLVWSAVHRLGVPREAADDAVQDVFVIAYRRWFERTGDTPRPWLYGITRRVAANYRRSALRRARKSSVLAQQAGLESGFENRLAAATELARFLQGLSARDRELFMLGEIEAWTGPEVAAALGMKASTAYDRLRTLRSRLRQTLATEDLDRLREVERCERPPAHHSGWLLLLPSLEVATSGGVGVAAWKLGLSAAVLGLSLAAGAAVASRAASGVTPRALSHPRLAAGPSRGPLNAVAPPTPSTQEPGSAEVPQVTSETENSHHAGPRRAPARSVTSPSRATATKHALQTSLTRDTGLIRAAAHANELGLFARALELTEEHAASFPESPLRDLRMALHIEALCKSDQAERGRREAQRFAQRYPNSPAGRRFVSAC